MPVLLAGFLRVQVCVCTISRTLRVQVCACTISRISEATGMCLYY